MENDKIKEEDVGQHSDNDIVAKELEYKEIAAFAYEVRRKYSSNLRDYNYLTWDNASDSDRNSNIEKVKFIVKNPNLTFKDIHNISLNNKKKSGWRFGVTLDKSKKLSPVMLPLEHLQREYVIMQELFWNTIKTLLGIKLNTSVTIKKSETANKK